MSESAANKNWVQVPFGAVATLINGRAYKQPEMLSAGTPILRIQNLNGGSNWYYSDLDLPDDKYCNPGDLLYAWSASFGPYRYNGPKAIFHYHIWNVVPDAGIDKAFVYYQLLRITDALRQSAHGVAMPHITKAGMEAWEIGLPPFPEQKRIADKLDTVLTRVDACRDRLARVAPLLKRFRQSVLAAATSGRLTEDWHKAVAASDWRESTVSEVCESGRVITYGVVKLGDETDNGIPCLRTSNVRWLSYELDGLKRISSSISADYARTILRGGEVLVNVRGTLGGVAVATDTMAGWNISREVAVIPVDKRRVQPKYLAFVVASEGSQRWLAKVEKGVAYVGINIEDLRNLPLSIPNVSEQTEIVRRVETLFAFADRLESRLKTAQTAADRLTPALLAKAFRGEMVPQDPNDEPAAELLKRLATSRDAAPKAKRGRRSATADTTP